MNSAMPQSSFRSLTAQRLNAASIPEQCDASEQLPFFNRATPQRSFLSRKTQGLRAASVLTRPKRLIRTQSLRRVQFTLWGRDKEEKQTWTHSSTTLSEDPLQESKPHSRNLNKTSGVENTLGLCGVFNLLFRVAVRKTKWIWTCSCRSDGSLQQCQTPTRSLNSFQC